MLPHNKKVIYADVDNKIHGMHGYNVITPAFLRDHFKSNVQHDSNTMTNVVFLPKTHKQLYKSL